jgi:hypothetical protein
MAGVDPQILLGGGQPTLTTGAGPSGMGGGRLSSGDVPPHHGLIGIVLVAVLVLFLLDRAGFRFAVTVGKR